MMARSDDEDGHLKECFELQLSEIEMLSSMYPDFNEFSLCLPSVLVDVNSFIAGKSNVLPNQLDFNLSLNLDDINEKLEVNVTFPHKYPSHKPLICVRSIHLSRSQQRELNSAISDHLSSICPGDLCIISLINFLIENASNYFSLQIPSDSERISQVSDNTKDEACRKWIYSHHIYNKFKRKEILDSAQDLNLTGFSLPGKPGFICIEGNKKDCSEFMVGIRQMNWKKLSLVKEEIEDNIDGFRKFENFQEICFQVRRGPAKEYHMDMGQFFKYLEEHNCASVFHDLFGFEGHTSVGK